MKNKIILQIGGWDCYISKASIKSKCDIIGFYFDGLGYVQQIKFNSVYGEQARKQLE